MIAATQVAKLVARRPALPDEKSSVDRTEACRLLRGEMDAHTAGWAAEDEDEHALAARLILAAVARIEARSTTDREA